MSTNPFTGTWTYRSLLNDPDVNTDFGKLEFGRGTLVITETDPVIRNGEMVAEYHSWYGSAATMMVAELHEKLTPKTP